MQTYSRAFVSNCRRSFRAYCSATEAKEAATPVKQENLKNISEVARELPNGGVGQKFTRLLWIRNGYENSYWTVSKVVEKNKGRLRYYGRKTWKGVEEDRERPVITGQKRGWTLFGTDLNQDQLSSSNTDNQSESHVGRDG